MRLRHQRATRRQTWTEPASGQSISFSPWILFSQSPFSPWILFQKRLLLEIWFKGSVSQFFSLGPFSKTPFVGNLILKVSQSPFSHWTLFKKAFCWKFDLKIQLITLFSLGPFQKSFLLEIWFKRSVSRFFSLEPFSVNHHFIVGAFFKNTSYWKFTLRADIKLGLRDEKCSWQYLEVALLCKD